MLRLKSTRQLGEWPYSFRFNASLEFKKESVASRILIYLLLFGISTRYVDGFATPGAAVKPRQGKIQEFLSASVSLAVDNQGIADEYDVKPSYLSIDPLILNSLKESSSTLGAGFDISSASNGIRVWRSCLCKGRFPIDLDFDQQEVWPAKPLFSELVDAMTTLQLPRFVSRHPDTVSAVLLTLLRLTKQFMGDVRIREKERDSDTHSSEDYDDDDDNRNCNFEITIKSDHRSQDALLDDEISISLEDLERLASDIANSFIQEWNDVLNGVNLLDQLFGYNHDMLSISTQGEDVTDGDVMAGFGLEDGIWKHTGWTQIPALQNQIASMQELKELMKRIGRRPTAENSNEIQKFSPRRRSDEGGLGAEFDPQMKESVSGITLSGSLMEMLPSEAILLRGSSGALRRLFMAKKAESKLLSYQMSGWTDVPSVPITRPLYLKRMPSAPGGPIIVCLDTSWSMSGMREQLSKAVVLACVTIAHDQKRDCRVVAFSTERGLMEAGIISPDSEGIERLLNFLMHSFGGGTDVTGALKYAMETLSLDVMSAADILMISDGEIPDPPVSKEIMEALSHLKLRKGVEVHGLLVGKKESKPFSRLCTEVHDFLVDYDTQAILGGGHVASATTRSALQYSSTQRILHRRRRGSIGFHHFGSHRHPLSPLQAKHSKFDDDFRKTKKYRKKNRNDWDEDYDEDYMIQSTLGDEEYYDTEEEIGVENNTNSFTVDLKEHTKRIKEVAEYSLRAESWTPDLLLKEREAERSCWKYVDELKAAVENISEGLVERQEDSRLVVLAMISMNHILLLGVPGTGKSILGRRLSKLCNGAFFQRLLTKFTTPEELFGPLSLKSLEEDEYRRCTEGFLPTASIAFLDEIFKSNSAILNTLLTILNERKFDNAGGQEDCPIRCVVGASNELPESDELVALFDRFLLRKEILPVTDEGVIELLSMSTPGCDMETDESCRAAFIENLDDVITNLSHAADAVHIGLDICELLRDLRTFMRESHNVEISDRRLVKAVRLLKISAASHGRNTVDRIDCLLLQHCMWQVPEQRSVVRDWLWDNITPGGQIRQFRTLLDTMRQEICTIVRKTSGDVSGEFGARSSDIEAIQYLQKETQVITSTLQKHQFDLSRHIELLRSSDEFLWLDPDELKSLRQLLLPRADQALLESNKALTDSRCLELCVEVSDNSPPNELRLSLIQGLWDEDYMPEITFTDEEMSMGMKEAKKKYDLETFRKWKRNRKKLDSLL